MLENDIKPLITDFLAERGLILFGEKTHITHISRGFDFLGFNRRKYKGKLLIKPRKSNTLLFLSNLRELIKKHATIPVNNLIKLIKLMNPKLRGWSNYYRHCVAKQVFGYIGHKLFHTLWHGQKGVIQQNRELGSLLNTSSTVKVNGNFTVGRRS